MKNKLLTLIFFTITVHSCVDQGGSEVTYTMFNETDKTVKVLGFDKSVIGVNGLAEPITINPNSSFKVTRMTGFENTTIQRFYSIQGVDSVRIVFNNEKVLVLTLESTFSQGQTIFQGNNDYQHFITEQDYEDAEDCDGNCD